MVSLDVRQLSNSEMLNRMEAAENAGESEIWGRSRKYGIFAVKYASVAPKVNDILSQFLLDISEWYLWMCDSYLILKC